MNEIVTFRMLNQNLRPLRTDRVGAFSNTTYVQRHIDSLLTLLRVLCFRLMCTLVSTTLILESLVDQFKEVQGLFLGGGEVRSEDR